MLKTPGWEMMIVWYFFLGGIAGGAYFTAAIADNFGGPRDRQVARVGYVLSLPLVMACGILLIADLGVPTRFLNMLRVLKFWDPMSLGAWAVGAFGMFSFVVSPLFDAQSVSTYTGWYCCLSAWLTVCSFALSDAHVHFTVVPLWIENLCGVYWLSATLTAFVPALVTAAAVATRPASTATTVMTRRTLRISG